MDERRQPDSDSDPGHAEPPAWRTNGARHAAGALVDQRWSSAGAALEPSAEPLALLAAGPGGAGGGAARHRQPYVPGLDDDTPASGMPMAEPPLWREASRQVPEPPAPEAPAPGASGSVPAATGQTGPRATPPGAALPRAALPGATGLGAESGLPQRVPAEPDVPVSGEPAPPDPAQTEPATGRERWTEPELAFIADQLRRDDFPADAPPATFDVDAVVAAVREVAGVEAASVRTNPDGMHTLRLDLADDADPGQVSRTVARLLLERMGLAAAPQHVPQARTPQETAPGPAAAPVPSVPVQARAPQDNWGYDGLADPPAPSRDRVPGPVSEPVREPFSEPVGEAVHEPVGEVVHEPVGDLVDEPVHEAPEPVSRPLVAAQPGPRVVIDQVQVRTFGLEAAVEVLLTAGQRQATGVARGPAVDSYLVRLAAVAAAKAIDTLLRGVVEPAGQSRCFVEHTGIVPFGNAEVAVVVLLLVCGGWVEQLTGSALVDGDPRQAVVRATLGAVNRRLEALLD